MITTTNTTANINCAPKPCETCGTCPTCGRGPYYAQPYTPWINPWPYINPWINPQPYYGQPVWIVGYQTPRYGDYNPNTYTLSSDLITTS